jgi:hypothetical protein
MAKIALKRFVLLSVKPDDFIRARLLVGPTAGAFPLIDLNRPEGLFDLDRGFRAGVKAGSIRTLMANLGKKRTLEGIRLHPNPGPLGVRATLMGEGTDQLAGPTPRANLRIGHHRAPFAKMDIGKSAFHTHPPEIFPSLLDFFIPPWIPCRGNEPLDRLSFGPPGVWKVYCIKGNEIKKKS